MQLQSLEIQGFKSFPDHTRIDFHPGVTAIVGPNGCGKSNITDAIRWVLGEQSARALRGGKMQDVIFNGTSQRKRLSAAEVSVTFSNTDRMLPLDSDQIVISRRYYRSGDSEYLLNGSPCRLKDILELLADTGIGRDGYSIISQGKVDDILSEHTDERRRVFDEAAGIVKFKMRKAEAERKFERSQQNLSRVNDILAELESQLAPLEKQAQDARRYRELSSRLRDLDIGLCLLHLNEALEEEKEQLRLADDFHSDLLLLEEEKKRLEKEQDTIRDELDENEKRRDEIEKRRLSHQARLSEHAEALAADRERLRQGEMRLKQISEEKAEIELKLQENSKQSADREENKERLLEKQSNWKREFEEVQQKLDIEAGKLSAEEKEEISDRDRIEALEKEIFARRDTLIQIRTRSEQLIREDEELSNFLKEDREHREALKRQYSAIDSEFQSCRKKLETLQEESDTLKKKSSLSSQTLNRLSDEKHQLETKIHQESYSLETLKRLEENREGYHPGIKEITKASRGNPDLASGLLGTVAELIRVREAYETAIEMSLGPSLQYLVTETKEDATRLIYWLKTEKAGRETFLPLDRIERRSISAGERKLFESEKGYMGTLDAFMTADGDYELLLSHLGGRILLAEDMASAIRLSELCQKRLRIVTLQGEIIHPGGSMTGGQTKRGLSGLLSRGREIDQHEKRLQELRSSVSELEKRYAEEKQASLSLIEEEKALSEMEKALQKDLSDLKASLLELKSDIGHREELSENQERRRESFQKERSELQAQLQDLELKIHELDRQRDTLLTRLESQEEERQKSRQAAEELQIRRNELLARLESLEETLKGLQDIRELLGQEEESLQNQLRSQEVEKSAIEAAAEEMEKRRADREAEMVSIRRSLEEEEHERLSLREAQSQLNEKEKGWYSRREDCVRRETRLGEKEAQARQEAERIREKSRSEKNRIWENYQLSFHQAEALGLSIDSPSKAQKELSQIRRDIRALPPINHSAPEDYEQLSQRVHFLEEQRNDITTGSNELKAVIQELETSMRRQFEDELGKINLAFQHSFSELFNGGHSELQLGEGDVLECPILIKAQPPGKRLQSLSLLSGGEKALTAIALVFAIFSLRPAPFCILDEVESALDDSNVVRFAEYIKKYKSEIQFILVTHRKGTMEAAEQLYGITMREKGVSSVYSIRLSDKDSAGSTI